MNLEIWPSSVIFIYLFLLHSLVSGPVVAEAMFVNREEVPVRPIYRDPVSLFMI